MWLYLNVYNFPDYYSFSKQGLNFWQNPTLCTSLPPLEKQQLSYMEKDYYFLL